MYIERELGKKIKKYLKIREILAIIGPRQSGKTTLINHLIEGLPKTNKITLEDVRTLTLFEQDLKTFINIHIKPYDYVFIDEIQYSKQSGKNLKYIYDTCETKLLISGSSATEISIHSIKFLVGRIFIYQLYPLSFSEFLKYKNENIYNLIKEGHITEEVTKKTKPFLDEFMIYGGYPRVVLAQTIEEKKDVLKYIYNTYLLKEIKEILQLQEDYKLIQLINALALQIGGVINYNELAQISGYNYSEIKKYLNILEKTFICMTLRNYSKNKRTELIKSPKIFFYDTGFRNEIIKNYILENNDKGKIYENFVFAELIKKDYIPKYWRTKAKAEVDFIIEEANEVIPLEVKSSLSNISRSFRSFLDTYHPKKAIYISTARKNKNLIGKTEIKYITFEEIINIKNNL